MSAYRKLTQVASESDVQNVKEELVDRFGNIPLPVNNLLRIVKLKLLAESHHILNIYGKTSPYLTSGVRVTLEWKGERRFAAEPPDLYELSAGDEYISFTPLEGSDLFDSIAAVINVLEIPDAPLQEVSLFS